MRYGRLCRSAVWLLLVILVSAVGIPPSADCSPRSRLAAVLGDCGIEADSDSLRVLVPGTPKSQNTKLIGTSLFASGLFLCSWGITSWQRSEDQCCPTRNTENVLKIVVGVVLVNAGMFYLLGGAD
jgi:hypothetical protein